MSRMNWIVLAVVLVASLIGCDSVKAPHGGHVDQLPSGQYPHIVMESSNLQKAVVFGQAVVDPTTDAKPMRVTQPARNTANYPINVQYRFEFLDNVGRPLKSNTGWRFMNMPSRQEVFFEGPAMDTTATDWRLIVRSAR